MIHGPRRSVWELCFEALRTDHSHPLEQVPFDSTCTSEPRAEHGDAHTVYLPRVPYSGSSH